MAIKTVEQVLRAFVQWMAEQDGRDFEMQWAQVQAEPKILEAFTKLIGLAREGTREAALEEAAAMIEVLDWKEPNWQCAATEIRELAKKGAA